MLARLFHARSLAPLLALCLAACAPAFGADAPFPPNRFAATIVPAERFEVGATLVERHGQGGTNLILIPGLASGAWVWQSAVRRFAAEYSVYVLTFPGFDGRPAVSGAGMAAAQQSVLELILSRKLARPVLVGPALGGTMAIALAAQHGALIGGVVSVDGLPVMPGTEEWHPAQRGAMTGSITGQVHSPTTSMFAAQQQQYMRGTGVIDMARADELARLSARSDPQAVTRYMAEAISLDLRDALPAISAPVLVISPYFQLDAEQLRMTEQAKSAYYRALMQGTPN
ncbi:MAG: alpha/beta hydrolase, partial [Massilia sp.]|nr:alpha/beta hydrolase [Massilia sp.]